MSPMSCSYPFHPEMESTVNPVPRAYARGFGALLLQGVRNIYPVRLWMGFGMRLYGVHPRAYPVPTVLDRGRIVFSRRSWNGAYARGVLSFDLEALDRWYGVNRNQM